MVTQTQIDPSWKHFVWANTLPEKLPRLLLAVTGDVAEEAKQSEFDQACRFIQSLIAKPILDRQLSLRDVFVVPGNHDVIFTEHDPAHRFVPYCTFYNQLFSQIQTVSRPFARPNEASALNHICSFPEDHLLIAEVNSCFYVERETLDQSRGQIDFDAVRSLRRQLERIADEAKDWIKIALVHHHPVLLPSFIEPGRGVDAILNARSLLALLREHGFQLILHGHKHFPQVFSYDPDPAWAEVVAELPQLIVAGGSAGSSELPEGTRRSNTYNLITLKWNPQARHARIQIITRGLVRTDGAGPRDPDKWYWQTLRVFDKALSPYQTIQPAAGGFTRSPFPKGGDQLETERKAEYEKLRLNLPVVDVFPSLVPGQGYEARVRIVQHRYHKEFPKRVVWSAGPKFDRKICASETAPDYCAHFHYYGPVLIQAELEFSDAKVKTYVYAHLPEAIDSAK